MSKPHQPTALESATGTLSNVLFLAAGVEVNMYFVQRLDSDRASVHQESENFSRFVKSRKSVLNGTVVGLADEYLDDVEDGQDE